LLLDYFFFFVIKAFQQCVRLLPERVQEHLGIFLGRIAFYILKKRKRIALRNIARVFHYKTEEEREDIARRSFEKLGLNFIESLIIPYVPKHTFQKRFEIINRQYFDNALALKKGLIALVFHFGNWEIMGVTSFLLKHDIIALARPLKGHKRLNRFLNHVREETGLTIIPNENTLSDIMRHLRENKVVAILADQREKRSRAVFVEFFGEKVPTMRGIALIGMKTGAPVMPVYMIRDGFLQYRVVFNPPIEMEKKGTIDESVAANMRKVNAFLESLILKNPDEWFWVHRRWGRDS